jgi:erythronate-4-phosphate dehydrogenase
MKIVADDKIPFIKGYLENFAEVVYLPGNLISNEAIRDADALLIRTRTICNEKLLKSTSVRFIGTATIGTDHIDESYCLSQGIKTVSAPGCNAASVNQYVTSALAAYSRAIQTPLHELTIGVIGAGNVGRKVLASAKTLKMRVLANDPPRELHEGNTAFSPLDDLLSDSDIVTVHVPLTLSGQFKTEQLINGSAIQKMKKNALFINTSRGEVVDEEAVLKFKALNHGFNYVADVWVNEPLIRKDYLAASFLATPHIAGYSTDGKANGSAIIVNALCRYFSIEPTDWFPENIPCIVDNIVKIDNSNLSPEEVILRLITITYDIQSDDMKLRWNPGDFEKIRNNYPVRREAGHFTIHLSHSNFETEKMLSELGFIIG